MPPSFFNEVTLFKRILYTTCVFYVICTAIAVVLEPYLTLSCDSPATTTTKLTFPNPFYVHNPCRSKLRYIQLMGLTRRECEFGRNMVMALLLGGIIGYERRTADRPAGIRTMSVVSLTSCVFTLNSTFVFMIGPMSWDPARVSASVPSGVGFLGAGLMVQDIHKDYSGVTTLTVMGLNTAASVWLSAAVGVACGGGLYFSAIFTTALMLVLLRFGPRATLDRADSVLGMSLPYRSNAP